MLTDSHPIENDVDEDPPGSYHSTYRWAKPDEAPPCPMCTGTLARENGTLDVWPKAMDEWFLVCDDCGTHYEVRIS